MVLGGLPRIIWQPYGDIFGILAWRSVPSSDQRAEVQGLRRLCEHLQVATNSRLGKASTCEHVEWWTYWAVGSVLYASLDAAMRAEYMRERSDTCAEY